MALNLSALDQELLALERRTQMIQDIKRLATDPEARALLESILVNGSNAAGGLPAGSGTAAHGSASAPALPRPLQPYVGLSQVDCVRRAIGQFDGRRFVVGTIGNNLRAAGFDIDNVAIGKVLRRLTKDGELRIAEEGGGSVPNQYEATEKFRMA